MPKGAKKRKAAKKKMESGAHSKPPGIDVAKTQDSDGSGLSTPASLDRDSHQSPFDVGSEDQEKRDPSPVEGAAGNEEDGEKVVSEGAVEVVRESDSKRGDENKVISIERAQSSKGSHGKDGSSSSSSSSDDESREDEKAEKDETGDSVVEENQLMEKETAEEVSNLYYKDDTSSSSNSSDDESRVHDKKVAEAECNSVVEKPSPSAGLVPKEASQPREEAPVEEVVDTVEPVVSVPEEEIHVKECVSVQNSVASESAVSVSKENGEKKLAKSNGLVGEVSQSKTVEDSALPISYKNGEASSKVVSSSSDPNDKAGNGTEHAKTYDIPQYPENEHRLPVVAPRPVQTTSWKGCCGLFEVFMGSNR